MQRMPWQRACVLGLLVSLVAGCGIQAPYMRGWQTEAGYTNRWTGGTVQEQKLSADEAAVHQELGTPDVIRSFRRDDRQPARVAQGDVVLFAESENVGVELQRLRLVVDQHAGHDDFHRFPRLVTPGPLHGAVLCAGSQ